MTTWWAWAGRRLRAGRTLVAVLFAVVVLTTAILAGSLGNSGLLATRAAQAALANPATGDAGIQLQTRMGENAQQQDTLVRDTLTRGFSPIPIDVWTSLVSEPRSASLDGTALPGRVVMWSAQQLAEPNLTLTDGAWAKGPGEATLSAAAAGLRDIAVGATIDVGGQFLVISGLWRPTDPSDAMWLGDPLLRTGASGDDIGPLVVTPEVLAASGSPFIRWVVVPDGATIKPAQLPMLAERAQSAAKAVKDADVSGRGLVVTGDLAPTAEQAARDSASGDAFGFLPVSVLILIAVVGLTQVAGLLSASREPEESLLVARGASLRQILGVAAGESLLVALLGSVVGTGLALLVLRLAAGDWSQTRTVVLGGLAGLVIAALCLIGINLASAIRSARGFLPGRDRVRNVAGAALLVLAVALAVIATWQLRSAQSFVRVDDDGRVRLDVISALSPALLLAVSAVAVLVVLAPLTRLVEVVTHATRATGAWLASAQVARGLVLQAVAVVLTVLAVGTATFAAVFGGTATALLDDIADLRQAAPLRVAVDESADRDPNSLPPIGKVAGVTDTTPVWRADAAQIGDQSLPLVVASVEQLDRIALLPAGTALPSADAMKVGATGPAALPIPSGAGTLQVTLGARAFLDPWQAAQLASSPRQWALNGESEVTAAEGAELLQDYLAPASASATLLLRDTVTGLSYQLSTGSVTVTPGPITLDDPVTTAVLPDASASATFDLELPGNVGLVLDGVRFDVSATAWVLRSVDYTLSVAADGTPLLGAATANWSSGTAYPADQFQAYDALMEGALPPTFREIMVDGTDGVQGTYLEVEAPPLPRSVIDPSSATWNLTTRLVPGESEESSESIWVGPGLAFTGFDPAGGFQAPALPRPRVPVAITSGTSEATTLTVGDEVEIDAFGGRIPGVIAAVTDVIPGVPGKQGALIDASALAQTYRAKGQTMPWPDELWAGIDGDPHAVRAAVADLPSVNSVSIVSDRAGGGTAEVAASALWVAAACALALALAGLAASSATTTSTRRPEVAVLRALGMTPSAQARSRAIESGGVLVLATALGVASGWAVGWLVVRPVALSAIQQDPSFQVALRYDWVPWLVLLAAGALGAACIVAWQAVTVRRQALETAYREEVR